MGLGCRVQRLGLKVPGAGGLKSKNFLTWPAGFLFMGLIIVFAVLGKV